jgi:pSer/pThr/pTyr-binding forkhead associated (FHA) protein
MAGRVVIRHISGTRMHQTDDFEADPLQYISAGRDETSNVRFESQREDMVSREHLRITREPAGSHNYLLSDLNSRNGTFLNRQRISQPTRIHHLDIVQLGLQGPEFRFELDPPPLSVKPTRMMDSFDPVPRTMLPTREVGLAGASTGAGIVAPASRPVGRATVERMLGDTFGKVRKESNKTLWIGVAALVAIAMVGVTTFAMLSRSSRENDLKAEQQQKILLQMSQAVHQPPAGDPAVKAEIEQINGQLKKIIAQNRVQLAGASAAAQGAAVRAGVAAPNVPSTSYDEVFDRASQEYKSGNATAAYQDCASLIGADGSRWEGYYLAALSLNALQQPGQAANMFQYALQYAPDSARPSITQQLSQLQAPQNGQQAQQPQ